MIVGPYLINSCRLIFRLEILSDWGRTQLFIPQTTPLKMTATATSTRRLLAISKQTTSNSSNAQQSEKLVVVLPDGDRVTSIVSPSSEGDATHLLLNSIHIASFQVDNNNALAFEITSVGSRYEGATDHVPRYSLVKLCAPESKKDITIPNFWAAIYALFTLYHTQEHIPLLLSDILNQDELSEYFTNTGLGRQSAINRGQNTVNAGATTFLSRAAFWQGAGTTGYHTRSWLLSPTQMFPTIPSFTKNEMVIISHPLRPPKPLPGQMLYRRYCSEIGQSLELAYFDLDGETDGTKISGGGISRHMAAFHKWHNDARVNSAWSERGSLETHRNYVEGLLKDPSVLPIMMSWDGELMGYAELVYIKENHVAQHYPSDVKPEDWERGLHVLVGEEKFLGGGRAEMWVRSIAHYMFIADPRCMRVVGEPKQSNEAMVKVGWKSGFHVHTVFDFPYKRSVLLFNPRDRFFNICGLR
ncbi:acyl-CoA N-acyltransferase [Crucibulum laeve]|uniref:Acyl-CoA N-acyltransferase n=1 Tax=Crucibulum laeve TaxID=68775 RepID=A0A5C3M8F9_9AGAR|nr:acyl-CoA N-acyltransferase [Crucibulum laeve]